MNDLKIEFYDNDKNLSHSYPDKYRHFRLKIMNDNILKDNII